MFHLKRRKRIEKSVSEAVGDTGTTNIIITRAQFQNFSEKRNVYNNDVLHFTYFRWKFVVDFGTTW